MKITTALCKTFPTGKDLKLQIFPLANFSTLRQLSTDKVFGMLTRTNFQLIKVFSLVNCYLSVDKIFETFDGQKIWNLHSAQTFNWQTLLCDKLLADKIFVPAKHLEFSLAQTFTYRSIKSFHSTNIWNFSADKRFPLANFYSRKFPNFTPHKFSTDKKIWLIKIFGILTRTMTKIFTCELLADENFSLANL